MNENAYFALEIMWKGMVSIFAVMILLTLTVWIVTHITKDDDKSTDTSEPS